MGGEFGRKEREENNIKNYKTAREQLKNLFGLLNCPNCGVKLKEIKWNEIISKKVWDEEYSKYQNSFSR